MLVLVLLVAGGVTVARRMQQQKDAGFGDTGKLAVPTVSVLKPSIEPTQEDLTLPGTMQAYVESAIYARTSGYLLHWTKDIGSQVKKGELLATIDTPEVDQELMQAKAARQQVEAQLQLAKTSAERWVNLKKSDSVSQQEVDQQTSGVCPGASEPGGGGRERAPLAADGGVQAHLCSVHRGPDQAQL